MRHLSITLLIPIGFLAACDAVTEPTISQADILAAAAEQARVSALPDLAPADLPTGAVDYSGKVSGDGSVDGDSGYSYLADLDLTVAFDGSREVSGQVSDVNLIFGGVPDRGLNGVLAINGSTAGTGMIATATGELEGLVFGSALSGTTDVNMVLSGVAVDDGDATALDGTATMVSTGDFILDFDGSFFATED